MNTAERSMFPFYSKFCNFNDFITSAFAISVFVAVMSQS